MSIGKVLEKDVQLSRNNSKGNLQIQKISKMKFDNNKNEKIMKDEKLIKEMRIKSNNNFKSNSRITPTFSELDKVNVKVKVSRVSSKEDSRSNSTSKLNTSNQKVRSRSKNKKFENEFKKKELCKSRKSRE